MIYSTIKLGCHENMYTMDDRDNQSYKKSKTFETENQVRELKGLNRESWAFWIL